MGIPGTLRMIRRLGCSMTWGPWRALRAPRCDRVVGGLKRPHVISWLHRSAVLVAASLGGADTCEGRRKRSLRSGRTSCPSCVAVEARFGKGKSVGNVQSVTPCPTTNAPSSIVLTGFSTTSSARTAVTEPLDHAAQDARSFSPRRMTYTNAPVASSCITTTALGNRTNNVASGFSPARNAITLR